MIGSWLLDEETVRARGLTAYDAHREAVERGEDTTPFAEEIAAEARRVVGELERERDELRSRLVEVSGGRRAEIAVDIDPGPALAWLRGLACPSCGVRLADIEPPKEIKHGKSIMGGAGRSADERESRGATGTPAGHEPGTDRRADVDARAADHDVPCGGGRGG